MSFNFVRTTIGELCREGGGNVQTGPFGSQLKAAAYKPVGIPTIMPADLVDYRVDDSRIARIGPEDHNRLARHQLQPGDIVYGRRGDIGRHALINAREQGWLCGTGCLRIRLGKSSADPQYVSYYLRQPQVIDYILGNAVGTTMPNLNTSILEAVPILLPPLPEQRAIAHILGSLDDKIELNRQMNQTLEAMARAIFKSWFVDFDPVHAKARGEQPAGMDAATAALFPASFEASELGPVPSGWRIGEIQEVANVTSGKRPGTRSSVSTDILSVPLYGGGGQMGYVDEPLYSSPIILTGRVGTLGQIFRITFPIWPSDNTLIVLPTSNDGFEYVYLAMSNINFLNLNRGSTQPLLTQTDLKQQPIVIFPSDVLHAFHSIVGALFDLVDHNVDESKTLVELRDTLLPKLMSGELRVPAAADLVPASIKET